MKTQQDISIRIADVAPISMTIPVETEELVRRAEKNINKVWNAWRNSYSTRTSKEVLAMVTFQFAKSYYQLLEQMGQQQQLMADFEAELDRLLDIAQSADSAATAKTAK